MVALRSRGASAYQQRHWVGRLERRQLLGAPRLAINCENPVARPDARLRLLHATLADGLDEEPPGALAVPRVQTELQRALAERQLDSKEGRVTFTLTHFWDIKAWLIACIDVKPFTSVT